MRTTLDLPDTLYREAKKAAVERGVTLKALLTQSLRKELGADAGDAASEEPAWWKHAGTLSTEAGEEMERFLAGASFSHPEPEDPA